MTKAAMCTTCGQVIGPIPRDDALWTWCAEPCLHTAVRWRDSQKGLLEVTSLHGKDGVLIFGLHNAFIRSVQLRPDDEKWREIHEVVTEAPGYLFDKVKRNCWAVVVRPGESNDVFFMPYGEAWAEREQA